MNLINSRSMKSDDASSFLDPGPLHMDYSRLRVALLALVPRDGTPISVGALATMTATHKTAVTDALFDDYMSGSLGFDVLADTFFAMQPKQERAHG